MLGSEQSDLFENIPLRCGGIGLDSFNQNYSVILSSLVPYLKKEYFVSCFWIWGEACQFSQHWALLVMKADNIPSSTPQGLNSVITSQQACSCGSAWCAMKFAVPLKWCWLLLEQMLTCRMWVTCFKYPVTERLQGHLCQLSRGNPGEQAGCLDILQAFFNLPVEAVQEHCIASPAWRAAYIFHPIIA